MTNGSPPAHIDPAGTVPSEATTPAGNVGPDPIAGRLRRGSRGNGYGQHRTIEVHRQHRSAPSALEERHRVAVAVPKPAPPEPTQIAAVIAEQMTAAARQERHVPAATAIEHDAVAEPGHHTAGAIEDRFHPDRCLLTGFGPVGAVLPAWAD